MLRWRSQPPFTNASVLDRRLAAGQLTEDDLLAVLSEPLECLRAHLPEPPAWLIQLEQAFADAPSCKMPSFPECTSDPTFGLLNLVAPLVAHGLARLKQSLGQVLQEQSTPLVNLERVEPIFVLYGYGYWVKQNCARCPETARLLRKIPGLTMAFFSVLAPKAHIRPHRGPYKGLLRYHLGLMIPHPSSSCRIQVGDEVRS
jgi:hypothetical protein